ncbi:MAG: pilus assembly protein PilM [Planctomycetaceae bacterium]|nr:pilus assembly protein PilM [Planctomycetaceae bacterium]
MPRILAIEWDAQEVRFAVGNSQRGGALRIEQAGTGRLPELAEGERRTAGEVGDALRAALAEAKVRTTTALVAVGRTTVELRQLTLPPAPEEELAELVRHQAAREFTSSGEGAALDFVPASPDSPAARVVTAAALSEPQLSFTHEVCKRAKLKPRRILLHSFTAGAWLLRRAREPVVLLVDRAEDDTDLTVLIDGKVFLSRTVRNASRALDAEAAAGEAAGDENLLVAEIRRTVIAVQNQAGGGTVAAIYVAGGDAESRELARQLQGELATPIEVFDPWSDVALGPALVGALPPRAERFTAVLGMLADEAEGRPAGLDFLNPRRKPEPANRRRLVGAGVAAAVVAASIGLYFAWEKFAEVGDQIARLELQSKQLDQLVKRGAEKKAAVASIEEWSLGDVVWLDELRDLALRFPQPRDGVLLRMTLAARPTGGGTVELEGLVRDPSIVGRMESQLRDEYHEINTRRVQESVQGKTNTWKFDSTLSVSRRSKDDYLAYQPVTPTARPAPPASAPPAAGAPQPRGAR